MTLSVKHFFLFESAPPRPQKWPDADMFSYPIGSTAKHGEYDKAYQIPLEVVIPAGVVMFHGTAVDDDFEMLKGPASLSMNAKTAEHYAEEESQGSNPRILEYQSTSPAKMIDYPGTKESNDNAAYWIERWIREVLGKKPTGRVSDIGYSRVPGILKIFDEAGYDGIRIAAIDQGGDEICYFHPENFLKRVR